MVSIANPGFARLAIAENQLALAPRPTGMSASMTFEPGLQRHGDRRAIHDVRRRAFDRQALARGHRPDAIQGPPSGSTTRPSKPSPTATS